MKTIEIAGGSPGFAASLLASFKERGWSAAGADGGLDMFVFVIDPPPCGQTAYDALKEAYRSTALALLEKTAAALPRLEKGTVKRLCFVNKLSSSVNLAGTIEDGGFERMAAAACNMAIRTMFNRLRPLGYTFRLYGALDLAGDGECGHIAEYCVRNRSLEEESALHSDENRLVLRDKHEVEYPY